MKDEHRNLSSSSFNFEWDLEGTKEDSSVSTTASVAYNMFSSSATPCLESLGFDRLQAVEVASSKSK
jgi:hypothetical protein